jgi:hypothetical protein
MDYRFRPISKTCAGTGEPLVPGSVCYSVLIEKNGQQERLDFSEAGWKGLPENAVGFWKCRVPVPAARQVSTSDPETLLRYFEQLTEGQNPQQEKLCYVLALYLLQRRRLRLDGAHERDGVEYLELSGSRGEGPWEIRDQHISEAEMAQLRVILDHQLSTQWEAA